MNLFFLIFSFAVILFSDKKLEAKMLPIEKVGIGTVVAASSLIMAAYHTYNMSYVMISSLKNDRDSKEDIKEVIKSAFFTAHNMVTTVAGLYLVDRGLKQIVKKIY